MGILAVAYQSRGTHSVDHWLINRKFWWSLLFWELGFIITNAYVVCVSINKEEGVLNIKYKSWYEFRIAISLHWINTDSVKE